jgi:peptide/nickel transport system permease protein
MIAYLVRRVVTFAATLLAAALVVFTVLEVLPGDPALVILGTEAREDTLAALRTQLGLDRPAPERFATWIAGMLTGDLGQSATYRLPVADLVGRRLAVTLPLALLAIVLTVALALPLGIVAAARVNTPADWGVMVFGQIGLAIPGFWLGIMLILVFAVNLGWFAAGGFPGWQHGVWPATKALLLPAVALAATEAAILARIVRAAILETMTEDHVRTARAKGLAEGAILRRHVLRCALIPIATIVGLQFGFLLAGTVVIETVFALPGLGRLVFQAIGQRDLPVVRDAVLLLAAMVATVNLAVDLVHAAADPRPRQGG